MTAPSADRSLLLALCALAAGCITTAEQQAKRNEERCVARGYQPKTDGFSDCIVRLETESDQRRESEPAAIARKAGQPDDHHQRLLKGRTKAPP